MATTRKFAAEEFAPVWLSKMQAYDGYKDHASKATIAHMTEGAPASDSKDFSCFGRMAPLLLLHPDDEPAFVAAAAAQATLTHNDPHMAAVSNLLAKVP